jgi:hypothetical protein
LDQTHDQYKENYLDPVAIGSMFIIKKPHFSVILFIRRAKSIVDAAKGENKDTITPEITTGLYE